MTHRQKERSHNFQLSAHVAALCRAGYYQLRQLRPVVQSIMAEAARTVAAAFISSCLGYCNALLHGLPNTLLHKLQSVQYATARLITGTHRCDHITPVLRELHWLPIRERAKFKLACLVHQSLSEQSPRLEQHMSLSAISRCPDVRDTTNLQQLWRQNLCSRWTSVVDSLPVQLRNPDISYGRFRRQLKGHLFGNDECGAL